MVDTMSFKVLIYSIDNSIWISEELYQCVFWHLNWELNKTKIKCNYEITLIDYIEKL